jgi:Transposase DDE domain
VQAAKLYHMGFREPVRRSTLADANEARDWRIYADFAYRLIAQARELYANDDFGLELTNTVYALDSTTIDLCLSLFPWAQFRSTKAAVKMHTLLDLRGSIPAFIHISQGKLHDVHALDLLLPEAGAIYVMDRAYVDFGRLYALHLAGAFFVTRAKSNLNAHRVYSAPNDRAAGIIADQTIALDGYATRKDYPLHLRRIRFKDPESEKTLGVSYQPNGSAGRHDLRPLQKPLAGRAILQMDQAAPAYQKILRHLGQRRADANLDRGLRLRPHRHRQKTACPRPLPLHFATDFLRHHVRENSNGTGTFRGNQHIRPQPDRQPVESIRLLTGQ